MKSKRDIKRVDEVLVNLKKVAKDGGAIMPVLIEAVKSFATIGEISLAMKEVFGDYNEPDILV